MFQSERLSNVQEHNLPVVRQGRRDCCSLLCCNLSRQRGRCRAPCTKRLPRRKGGDVLTVEFTVLGIPCLGLNGGPVFTHNEAFSFQIATEDQEETDRYWNAIVGNGGQESQC